MKSKKYRITPNKGIIAILLSCVIASCFLLVNKQVKHIPGYTPPEILLFLSLWALHLEWRTVLLCEESIYIQYHPTLIKREVSVERIGSIEYIKGKRQQYILISLKGCPTFANSKCRCLGFYVIIHPFSVIAIRGKQDDYQVLLSVTRGQGDGSRGQGDGLREP